jgi:kynurenine formamidase
MKFLTSIFILSLLISCNAPNDKIATESDRFARLFNGEMKIIDLTHSLNEESPFWPNGENTNPFKYKIISAQPSGASALGSYQTSEHNGTHMDAPIHFADNTTSVDEILPTDLFAPLVVIDVRGKCAVDPDYGLTVQDIRDWESKYGELPEGAVVIMSTGWSEKWDDIKAYQNKDESGKMHFPGFTKESNEFLVNERNIKGIGIDNLSVDPGAAKGFAAHSVTNGAGKWHLENVANTHLLPENGAFVIVAPIKIEGGSGGQVRIFAVIP